MARKGKKRSEERRQRKQRQEERVVAGEGVAVDAIREAPDEAFPPGPVEQAQRIVRKKRKNKTGPRFRVNGWFVGVPVVVGGVIALVAVILTSGSSGVTAPQVEATPDPRVAGLAITETIAIEAGGAVDNAYFAPSQIAGPVGEAFQIVVSNVGSVSHNLTIAGEDGEYGTSDDWSTERAIGGGEQGSVVVKIDAPATYAFRCALHPLTQLGTLVME